MAPGTGAPSGSSGPTGSSGPPPSVPHVQVTAFEYGFVLSRTTAPAGKIVFELVNHGQDEHNLNVESSEGVIDGSLPNTLPGHIREMELELGPGTYTLFCSLPGHEAMGMKAKLVVE